MTFCFIRSPSCRIYSSFLLLMFAVLPAELWSSCTHRFSWENQDWFIKFVMIFYLQREKMNYKSTVCCHGPLLWSTSIPQKSTLWGLVITTQSVSGQVEINISSVEMNLGCVSLCFLSFLHCCMSVWRLVIQRQIWLIMTVIHREVFVL